MRVPRTSNLYCKYIYAWSRINLQSRLEQECIYDQGLVKNRSLSESAFNNNIFNSSDIKRKLKYNEIGYDCLNQYG